MRVKGRRSPRTEVDGVISWRRGLGAVEKDAIADITATVSGLAISQSSWSRRLANNFSVESEPEIQAGYVGG